MHFPVGDFGGWAGGVRLLALRCCGGLIASRLTPTLGMHSPVGDFGGWAGGVRFLALRCCGWPHREQAHSYTWNAFPCGRLRWLGRWCTPFSSSVLRRPHREQAHSYTWNAFPCGRLRWLGRWCTPFSSSVLRRPHREQAHSYTWNAFPCGRLRWVGRWCTLFSSSVLRMAPSRAGSLLHLEYIPLWENSVGGQVVYAF
ncbi:hypothetical protein SAMN04489801_5983 [Pseudomonas mandelii]|uniref:Uncharacterized protein n=1 Tax=Pseudomonas mandelii TaxID=75612 RepID=A0ABY0W572_9PSED|nr:hypothetical protein SAMN04489801_5983 [Pseudomonas mandelii]